MIEPGRNQYHPAAVTPPGATLADLLDEKEITQAELAVRMDVTPKFVNELVAGKATITPRTALLLERALDVPADFWLAREAHYREQQERVADEETLASSASWLDELPLSYMRKFGWIEVKAGMGKSAAVAQCLSFFGVASVDAWRQQYVRRPLAAFRKSDSSPQYIACIATWLRQGELQGSAIRCRDFNKDRYFAELNQARSLTCETNPDVFVPKLTEACARSGVAVVFVREFPGCPISGATRWLSPRKALVQLSLRYKTNDHLWFTFFHESGHILKHKKTLLFLEGTEVGMSKKEEAEANQFAANWLIPESEVPRMRALPKSRAAIREFAESLGIAPGIVVGRMQKEKLIRWSDFNDLKVRYQWT
jgi:HTH-type transcriptional regulator/antitoxin HigA